MLDETGLRSVINIVNFQWSQFTTLEALDTSINVTYLHNSLKLLMCSLVTEKPKPTYSYRNNFFVIQQDSIEWFKDSLQGHVPLRSDTNSYYKIRTFSNELSFSKEISFDSVNLIDKGRYVCKVAEKASDYHDQPGIHLYYNRIPLVGTLQYRIGIVYLYLVHFCVRYLF